MARLPKSIIKKYGITKKAWSVFRGRKGKRRRLPRIRRTRRTRTSNPGRKRGVRRLVRRYRRRRRGGGGKSITRTAFKLIRLGALVAPGAYEFLLHGNDFKAGLGGAIGLYTGFDLNEGNFRWERLIRGWSPYLGVNAATYGIPKIVNIIRRL